MDRSYQAENARSRPLPEAKLPWASPVVGWVTTCEPDVTICPFASLLIGLLCFSSSRGMVWYQIIGPSRVPEIQAEVTGSNPGLTTTFLKRRAEGRFLRS